MIGTTWACASKSSDGAQAFERPVKIGDEEDQTPPPGDALRGGFESLDAAVQWLRLAAAWTP